MVFFFSFITECGIFIWVMFPLESMTDGKLVKENPYAQCAGGWVLGRRPFCPRRLSHSRTLAGSYLVVEQGINNIQVSWFLLQALTFVPWIHCVTSGESHKTSLIVTFLSCAIQLTQVPILQGHCELKIKRGNFNHLVCVIRASQMVVWWEWGWNLLKLQLNVGKVHLQMC